MPARIPTEIKESVIQSWLCGLTRRPNAIKHGVSEGSVDNFVNEWMFQRGPDGEYERIRALAITMSKTGLSIHQCADGHRTSMIMKNMGVRADNYESFISKLWKRHIASGSGPDILIEQINQLYFFLENNQDHLGLTTSFSEILEIIKSKLDTLRGLESRKQNLDEINQKLFIQKENVEAELEWDSQLKDKLNKNGFKREDVPRFVNATLLMKERGYNIFEIIEKFSEFEKIEEACASIQLKEIEAGIRHNQLTGENQALEFRISQNSLKLGELDSLRALGFGHDEFRLLRDIITEVGEATGLIGNEAVKCFFVDLRNNYYDYVRLQESVSKLKAERAQLSAGADMIQNLFQDFLKPNLRTGYIPKDKPDAVVEEDNKSRKNARIDDGNSNVVSVAGTTAEKITDSMFDTLHGSEEQMEVDRLCISHKKQEKREDNDLFERQDNTQENQGSELEAQLHPTSQGGSEKTDEIWPSMSQINNSITESLLRNAFGDNSKELKEWKRREGIS